MIDLDSLPPLGIETANAIAERKFAREVLELSVLLAVNMGDKEAFQCKAILHRLYQVNLTHD